ncbi:MAG TPA: hypothetical protein VFK43_18575, partial [Acidimicrobiales bacterium]|nr:hypothetical protein [Acidimicrobiales bacterium]
TPRRGKRLARRRVLVALAAVLALWPVVAAAVPTPEPNVAGTVLPMPCTADRGNVHEAAQAELDGWEGPEYERYPGDCQRLRFSFGPIMVKPGQNDVLVQPVVLEKPWYDGYVTRIRPDLVYEDGSVPPIEQVHLHHGTWLSVPTYGSGPFFAAGEEKTIAFFPRGYGMPVKATDQWLLLYMVHSAIPQPKTVYITYDVDYVPVAAAERLGIRPVYPVWLDVESGGYPVFNTQRAFGGDDGTCTYPAEQCAGFDPWGEVRAAQGLPANRAGADFALPARGGSLGRMENFQGGTIIGIGGHLHPGGLTNDIDVVRGDRAQRVYTGEARYWRRDDATRPGGPPTSWDFSMTVTGLPRWGVRVEPGDRIRSNATYDTTIQSTYENMGIAVALVAPDKPDGTPTAPGVDPFTATFDPSPDCRTGGLQARPPTLCDKGVVTHGHLAENDNFGGPDGRTSITDRRSGPTGRVDIAGFLYHPGDLSMVSMNGLPTVPLGSTLTFANEDTLLDVFHTATSCAYPCTGATGTAFPLANGRSSAGRQLDFDSGELGYGMPYITGAKNELQWQLPVTPANGFRPGEVITYFCRVHPFMRGAFEVVG